MKNREKYEIDSLQVFEVPHPHLGKRTGGRCTNGGKEPGTVHDSA